jgi:hypothetical protein
LTGNDEFLCTVSLEVEILPFVDDASVEFKIEHSHGFILSQNFSACGIRKSHSHLLLKGSLDTYYRMASEALSNICKMGRFTIEGD